MECQMNWFTDTHWYSTYVSPDTTVPAKSSAGGMLWLFQILDTFFSNFSWSYFFLFLQIFEHILYIWAIRHPASGYVQGINDLVTPFFVVFLSEFVSDG